jgi:hypothetical protein
MTPLDLTKAPPRPCRAELDGIVYLPRAIDKVRAALPGGNLGQYLNVRADIPTLSALFYRRMGLTHEEFVAAVSEAADEDAVVAWLRARVDSTNVEKFARQYLGIRLGDLDAESFAALREFCPNAGEVEKGTFLIDFIDADDAAMFANSGR